MRRSFVAGVAAVVLALAACVSSRSPDHPQSAPSSAPAGLLDPYGYTLVCGGVAGCPSGGVPSSLWRPLHLSSVGAGDTCPASGSRIVSPDFGLALGAGPVYAVIGHASGPKGVLTFEYPPGKQSIFSGSTWGGNKVLWIASPSYIGPVLIRGKQLDGPHWVGFSVGGISAAYADLQFAPGKGSGSGGWRNWPSQTRLQASGCYAYQVDGTTFSEVIVFRGLVVSQ